MTDETRQDKAPEKPTYAELADRLSAMRKKVWALRKDWHDIADENDQLKLKLKNTEDLAGSDYSHRMACNDGRVWARPAWEDREDCIRFFAAHALSTGSIDFHGAASEAFNLWEELEMRFGKERAEREAALAAKREAETAQGELWEPDDVIGKALEGKGDNE